MLHWLAVHLGVANIPASQAWSNAWGGPISDLGLVAIVGGMIANYRKHVCHSDGCHRIGKHTVDGTPWCNKHHTAARDKVS